MIEEQTRQSLINQDIATRTHNQTVDALKLAYRYASGDLSAGTEETRTALCDVLCEILGDGGFQAFVNDENLIEDEQG